MNGFLALNKPKHFTSFDVIAYLRKKFQIRKIGHSGTLDPLATGVMLVAVGNATKFLEFMVQHNKTYEATLRFLYTSKTYDAEGPVTQVSNTPPTKEELLNILPEFTGKILQIPPQYSAIKIQGKKACNLIRKGQEIDMSQKQRSVCIYENTLLSFSENEAKIRVSCSSGTYIRTLAHDIGQKLGCGAYLSDLVRTQIEDIPLSQCVSLEDADFHHFFSPRNILPFPEYEVNTKEYEDLAHGKSITPSHSFSQNYISIVKDNIFYGVAFYNETYNKLQAKKIIPPNLPLLP